MTTTTWATEPTGPFTFMHGIIDVRGFAHVLQSQFDLTIERAAELFAEDLPVTSLRWALVHDSVERRVLAYVNRSDGVKWGGTKAGYDTLAKYWDADEVAWWATIAENFDLQDAK